MGCAPSTPGLSCNNARTTSPRPSIDVESFENDEKKLSRIEEEPIDEPRRQSSSSCLSDGSKTKKKKGRTVSITEPYESRAKAPPEQGVGNHICFGPMRFRQQPMSVLLVFAKEDSQSEALFNAAQKVGYKVQLARNSETALENYLDRHHDVIFIDHRQAKHFDAESLCRSIRATKASEHTTIVAAVKRHTSDKEEPSMMPLLNAGFNRRFVENTNVGSCLNELLCLEHCEVRSRLKLRAADALFTALDNVCEMVEITNAENEIEYVNTAFERQTGYASDEVLGKDSRKLSLNDKTTDDLNETISTQLRKGKQWEGQYSLRRKSGDVIQQFTRTYPVQTTSGITHHHVSIRSGARLDRDMQLERLSRDSEVMTNGGVHSLPRRRESMARIHSMTIEAPITKIINIINAAQENSSNNTVSQALDKVLEILRSSDLYSPLYAQQVKEEDQMTNDLVGGLMSKSKSDMSSEGIKRRFSNTEYGSGHRVHHSTSSPTGTNSLIELSEELQNELNSEANWAFDIIKVERLTQNRPLVYVGMQIFNRFGVPDFLQVNESVIRNWLQVIEANYHSSNPYHNSTHAADVLQSTAFFLDRARIKNCLSTLDEVASLIAAVIHDVDHPGKTSAFLVNSGAHLAILYNDLAVLENHHASLGFLLTSKDDRVNIFKNVEYDDYRVLRQMIVDMVLATEMTKHFEHVGKFVNNIIKVYCKSDDEVSTTSENNDPSSSDSPLNGLSTPENRTLIKRMLIKCADVSNPVRPFEQCAEWARRISEEYFRQTEAERKNSLPVMMPNFDRNKCSVPKSQIGFIDFFVNDMYNAWDEFIDIPELVQHLQVNYDIWKGREEEQSKEAEKQIEEEKEKEEEAEA